MPVHDGPDGVGDADGVGLGLGLGLPELPGPVDFGGAGDLLGDGDPAPWGFADWCGCLDRPLGSADRELSADRAPCERNAGVATWPPGSVAVRWLRCAAPMSVDSAGGEAVAAWYT